MQTKKCPYCHKGKSDEAVCPHCGRVIVELIKERNNIDPNKPNKKGINALRLAGEILRWIVMIPVAIIGSFFIALILTIPFTFLEKALTGDYVSRIYSIKFLISNHLYQIKYIDLLSNITSAIAGIVGAYLFVVIIYFIAPRYKEIFVKILATMAGVMIFLPMRNQLIEGDLIGIPSNIFFILTLIVMVVIIDEQIPFGLVRYSSNKQ